MSFFGFDPSQNPTERGHPTKAPGFGETPDHFAGLSSRATDNDDDDDGLVFFCSSNDIRKKMLKHLCIESTLRIRTMALEMPLMRQTMP
jgi:hypothetical protein